VFVFRRLLGAALVLTLAGCGGAAHERSSTAAAPRSAVAASLPATVYPDDPQVRARAMTAGQRRDLERLWMETQAIRRAAAGSRNSTLNGDRRVRNTVSRFMDDLARSRIDDLSKNRAIDHAAAAAGTVCEQCFQELEAVRPIPAIAH
jgi:hypothetical protein